MRSLRLRLLVGVTLAAALVMLLAGALAYALVQHALRREFDRGLLTQAQMLAPQVELDGATARIDFDNAPVPLFERRGSGEYFTLWSADGRVLEASGSLGGAALPWPGTPPRTEAAQALRLAGGEGVRLVLVAVTPRAEGDATNLPVLYLGVARSAGPLEAVLGRILWMMAIVGGVAVVALGAVLAAVVGVGLRPLRTVAATIVAVGEDDLSARVRVADAPLELVPVVDELNALLTRLEEAFAREKAFTANVAHELRTPLYGLRVKLEVALGRPRTAESYRRTLAECLAITCTTQTMAENLLTLARLDAGQITPLRETLEVGEFARGCWDAFADRAAERGLSIHWRGPAAPVCSDPDRLRIVLNNLLDNAVSYADDGGTVEIETMVTSAQVQLRIRNTGNTLDAAALAQCSARFWRGPSASAAAGEHCGLGLALAQRLTRLLGHGLTLTVEDGGWFCATLALALPAGAELPPFAPGPAPWARGTYVTGK